jgi:uncharacterized protein DUF4440
MKNLAEFALAAGLLALPAVQALPARSLATDDATAAVLQADHSLLQAFQKADRVTVDRLLDSDFNWIDSREQSQSREQVLQSLPMPANADVDVQSRVYGKSGVLRANRGRVQVLRVWAQRASGWKLILYQEVILVEKSEPPAAGDASGDCENPCKSIPFVPGTPSEKEAIASWQGVMRAMATNDAEAYSPLIAAEFTATDTHHDRPFTKTDRLAQIQKQKQSGARSMPPAMISARMFDFGETVMMIALEKGHGAKSYFNTRMWVKRDARWQMLFSFNTRIE